MKPTEITMQIVKSIGIYETARFGVTYELLPTDNLQESFLQARQELEKAYEKCYGVKPKLTDGSKETEQFKRICKALHEGKTDIEDLRKYFDVSAVMDYFKENKLI